MICRSCGKELPDGTDFCKECGALQDEQQQTEAVAPEEEVSQEVPAEELETLPPLTDDDFDPRAFAGLNETGDDFDPTAFAGLDMDEEENKQNALAEEEQPAKKGKKEKAPKEPKKAKKKRKAGAVVALVLVIVLVVAAAAAGLLWWLTMPLEEDVLISDFTKKAQLEAGETVLDFTIDRRDTDRLGLSDAVWCSVVTETESVRRERTYQMTYELTKEGWTLDAVDGTDTAAWVTTPLLGISLEQLQATLVGRELTPEEDYTFTLTAADLSDIEITSQTPDLTAGTDTVEATITVTNDLVAWTVDATIVCSFDEIWNVDTLENTPAEIDFKPGYDFNLEEDDLRKALYANPITLGADDKEEDGMKVIDIVEEGKDAEPKEEEPLQIQTVKVTKSTLSEFTMDEGTFCLAEGKYLAKCSFVLDKGVAKLFVNATLICAHNGSAWEVEEVEYDAEVEKIDLTGTWLGSYTTTNGKKPDLTVIFGAAKEDGSLENTFNFKAPADDLTIPTGCWLISSKNDLKTMKITIEPGEWKNNPGAANPMDQVTLKGVLMIDDAIITDGTSFTIKLDRPEPVEEPEEEAAQPTTEPTAQPDQTGAPTEVPANDTPSPIVPGSDLYNEINDPSLLGPNDLPIS